ncbi:MAG: efflux RND transporter periplasmic adaptor subunit [Phycisphaerae bacterium]|nr:efflux RND transporter periplasmic adaptor subunit [Phycisphaerae bacterium]
MSDARARNERRKGWIRSNRVRLAVGLVAVAGLVAVGAIPAKKREAPAQEVPPVNVVVQTVAAEPDFADGFDLPAVVEPNRVVRVSAEVAGRIVEIGPSEGSAVRAGDLLIRLDGDLLRPLFETARAQLQRDQIEYERMEDLVRKDATSKKDLDDATTRLAVSQASFNEIRARLDRTRITAPNSGVLNDLLVEEGEYVQPGTPVAEIVDTGTVKVVVDVPERDIAFFAVGQTAQVLADVKGQVQTVEGTIAFLSEVAHPLTRSTRMEIRIPNPKGLLRSGQIVRVHLVRRVLQDAILIPLLAVIPMEDHKAVYVVDPNQTARRVEVRLGILKGDRIQVMQGLEPGDQLIVSGHRFVAPGQRVRVASGEE